MITTEASDQSLTITFRRSGTEKWTAIVLALLTLEAIYIAFTINVFPRQTHLVCTRATDICRVNGYDIFGGGWKYSFAASAMKQSRITTDADGDPRWVVELVSGTDQELGAPTGRRTQLDAYAENSAALQSFIDDRAKPSFETRFDAIGGPGGIVWLLVLLLSAAVLVRFTHGWRTRLVLDRVAGDVTIARVPALLPRARRLPLTDVVAARRARSGVFLWHSYVPVVSFRLIGRNDRVLFRRRMMASRRAETEIHAAVRAVNDFVHPTT